MRPAAAAAAAAAGYMPHGMPPKLYGNDRTESAGFWPKQQQKDFYNVFAFECPRLIYECNKKIQLSYKVKQGV